jgi:predicted nuclease of predicted toxin-antitoxin system
VARLYANENFPRQVVQALRTLGHDVLTVVEAGNANQRIPDDEVLAFAMANERAVLTLNRYDFVRLHDRHPDHHGIIVCAQDPDTDGQAARIHEAIAQVEALAGRLIRVNCPWR